MNDRAGRLLSFTEEEIRPDLVSSGERGVEQSSTSPVARASPWLEPRRFSPASEAMRRYRQVPRSEADGAFRFSWGSETTSFLNLGRSAVGLFNRPQELVEAKPPDSCGNEQITERKPFSGVSLKVLLNGVLVHL